MEEERPKRMALIASQGTLDWAYPPFILASTAVAMEMQVAVFFTFYGLTLLKRKITAKVAPHANPAMPMKMPFGPKSFQNFEWPMPNMLMGNLSLIHISEPTRRYAISYAVFCLKKKKKK